MKVTVLAFLLIGSFLLPQHALAASDRSWSQANQALVDEHVIPGYRKLADSAAKLDKSSRSFCDAPDEAGLQALRDDFHQTMDAWMGIQHIRFGPVDLFLRHSRIHLWPDKHNTGARQLRQALSEKDESRLDPERFQHTSVALQGLGTLERLIYPDDIGPDQFKDQHTGQPGYRCKFVEAITRNLGRMSRNIVREWTDGEPSYREIVRAAGQGNDTFESSRDVSGRFLNNLYAELQLIVDEKLLDPLGAGSGFVNARATESWRSRRSLRNIQMNLEALQSCYRTGFSPILSSMGPESKELDRELRQRFTTALAAARSIEGSLYDAIDSEEMRTSVKPLLESMSELKRGIGGSLPLALDLSLGFNSLDGD